MAAGWKKILTEDDGNLATANLTTSSSRTYTFTGSAGLTFVSDNSSNLLQLVSGPVGAVTDYAAFECSYVSFRNSVSSASGIINLYEAADSASDEYVGIEAPTSLASSYTLTLPTTNGDANQVLKTDGSGNLSWVDQSAGGVTINNNTDNYLLTASGTLNTINGEADITFDGTKLKTGRHFEYQPDAGPRAGELYDGTDTGVYAANGDVTGGDMIFIPKANTGVTLSRVYTISTAGQAELVSAATSSTNIGKIALLSPSTATSGGATQQMYVRGMATLRTAAIQGTFAYGAPIYLNPSTAGALTFSQPTTSNQYVRRMGYAINAVTISTQQYYIIWFDPSHEYVKIT